MNKSEIRQQILRKKYLALLGGTCVKCLSTENLEFDHIDPKTKNYEISKIIRRPKKIAEEIKLCQLLCKTCHAEKSAKEKTKYDLKPFRHGKCGCGECLAYIRKKYDRDNDRRRKTRNKRTPYEKNPTHGSTRRYYRGCRCPLCKIAMNQYYKDKKEKG